MPAVALTSGAPVRLRVVGELPPGYLQRIRAAWPEARTVAAGMADVVLVWDYAADPDAALAGVRPRWIHTRAAGCDPRLLPYAAEAVVTTGGGHGPAVAEHVLAMLLAHYRRLPELVEDQAAHRWRANLRSGELSGRTVGVIGLGDLGSCTARLLSAVGARAIGVSRSGRGAIGEFVALQPVSELMAVLPSCAALVLAAPLTPQTSGLIGHAELAGLPAGAFLVNVARAGLVDESALIRALRSGHLAGAALDVFDQEPLPADSPLWSLPNVLVSPHCADNTEQTDLRCLSAFLDNVARVRNGLAPLRIVNPKLGY